VGFLSFKKYQNQRRNRWIVSYSDFTTILLALFMMLYIGATTENKELRSKFSEKPIEAAPQKENKNISMNKEEPGVNLLLQGVKNPSDAEEIRVIEFDNIAKQLKETTKDENIQIIKEAGSLTVRMGEGLLFDSASAEIKPKSKQTLDEIAKVLTKNQKHIRIEGHSDNLPIKNTKYSTNWELSSVRASKIADYLIVNKKLDKKRFTVAGYADIKPIATNSTSQGRAKNRRVDIIILN
jgi:chemotaxis protein MotB